MDYRPVEFFQDLFLFYDFLQSNWWSIS